MLAGSKVLVIGGSSGMGLAIAGQASRSGAQVFIAGRTKDHLDRAVELLGGSRVEAFVTDIGDLRQVRQLLSAIGSLDHMVITAADLVYGPVRNLTEQALMRAVRSKLLGPLFAVQECADRMPSGGSITLTSGIAARRPMVGGAAAAALNGALEGLGRALAIELAPIRVNMISPGWTDTPIWNAMPGMTPASKQERFSAMAKRLPVGRIGHVDDIASAAMFLMTNGFVTGTTLHVDGGHQLA
jgi:NAD(P)-dependent dehydrogenase (short-subunit alcohol dehydrogenase family)